MFPDFRNGPLGTTTLPTTSRCTTGSVSPGPEGRYVLPARSHCGQRRIDSLTVRANRPETGVGSSGSVSSAVTGV
jgi:hypothetical protein